MRRSGMVAAALVLVLCVGAVAADVFQTYGLDRQGWSEAFLSALTAKWFNPSQVPAKLKTLAPADRVAVVNALGAAAKAWVETPEFKAAYKKKYDDSLPAALKPPRTAKQIADELRAEQAKAVKDMDESMKSVPAEMRKQMEEAAAQMKAALKQQEAMIGDMAAAQAEAEKAEYEEAKRRPPDPDATPADSRVALKRALTGFLDATSGVDYAAALTTGAYSGKKFVNPDYEKKAREWKMCYRAGKDACDAARAFAAAWLAELK